jgi:hypothetical protein
MGPSLGARYPGQLGTFHDSTGEHTYPACKPSPATTFAYGDVIESKRERDASIHRIARFVFLSPHVLLEILADENTSQ